MIILTKKTGLIARLFCVLAITLLSPSSVRADKKPIPKAWIEEAEEDRKEGNALKTIPNYELQLVERIRENIIASSQNAKFSDYTGKIEVGDIPYEMLAIKGGTFLMGSPPDEKGRKNDEGLQKKVTVSDFWMGKNEVIWTQFIAYSDRKKEQIRNRTGTPRTPAALDREVDWVSAPTEYYMPPDVGMGMDDGFPAVGMTQHSANKFCQWLSALTGHFYRLPTEAEWEYACRAGTTGPFSCEADNLGAHAVGDPYQVRDRYEKVGTMRPNPWGLYDMHGNVLEWCLDGYSKSGYDGLPSVDPWRKAKERYPRIVRGGSWYDDDPSYFRSAARLFSDSNWNLQDPQLPRSLWWLVDAQWVGFRLVRPVEIPSTKVMFEMWNTGAIHGEELKTK